MQGTDTIAFSDGFTGISQGNWQRAGFRSRAVSGKSISLNYGVEGDFEDYIVREFSFEFSGDRTTLTGNSSTSLFNAEQDPLDPAATPDVVITSSLAGRKLQ